MQVAAEESELEKKKHRRMSWTPIRLLQFSGESEMHSPTSPKNSIAPTKESTSFSPRQRTVTSPSTFPSFPLS